MKTTHIISATYFPNTGEVDATWEDCKTCEAVHVTFKTTPEIGAKIAKIVPPCVYAGATRDIVPLIDIDREMLADISQAVDESNWITENYTLNDVVADICKFLRGE